MEAAEATQRGRREEGSWSASLQQQLLPAEGFHQMLLVLLGPNVRNMGTWVRRRDSSKPNLAELDDGTLGLGYRVDGRRIVLDLVRSRHAPLQVCSACFHRIDQCFTHSSTILL